MMCRHLNCFSPNINLVRDPRWGRNSETLGEDPWLTGKLAAAYVQGLQGNHSHLLQVLLASATLSNPTGVAARLLAASAQGCSVASTSCEAILVRPFLLKRRLCMHVPDSHTYLSGAHCHVRTLLWHAACACVAWRHAYNLMLLDAGGGNMQALCSLQPGGIGRLHAPVL